MKHSLLIIAIFFNVIVNAQEPIISKYAEVFKGVRGLTVTTVGTEQLKKMKHYFGFRDMIIVGMEKYFCAK